MIRNASALMFSHVFKSVSVQENLVILIIHNFAMYGNSVDQVIHKMLCSSSLSATLLYFIYPIFLNILNKNVLL